MKELAINHSLVIVLELIIDGANDKILVRQQPGVNQQSPPLIRKD